MPKGSRHSPELEAALIEAVDAVYGPGEIDSDAATAAVMRLLETSGHAVGTASQQLALGTFIVDTVHGVETEEDIAPVLGASRPLPERVMTTDAEGQTLDAQALVNIAANLLRRRESVRDTIAAYCALRLCGQVPEEAGELRAVSEARAVTENTGVTDRFTRIYSRRVLALVGENTDEVFAVVRQAQEEGNAHEVVKLVECSYARMQPPQAMSLLALGVTAADDLDDPLHELSLFGALCDVATVHFHQMRNNSESDDVFALNTDALGLANEFEVYADRLEREPGCAHGHMVMLAHAALAHAILNHHIAAEALLERLQVFAGRTPDGIPPDVESLCSAARETLAERASDQPAADDADDDDDERNDPADAWKNN